MKLSINMKAGTKIRDRNGKIYTIINTHDAYYTIEDEYGEKTMILAYKYNDYDVMEE